MYRLGKEYMLGRVIERNDGTARYWLSEAEQRGNPYAAYQIGKMFLEPEDYDYDTAKYYLNRAAIWGNEHAQYLLERLDDEPKSASILLATTRLLYHLSNIFQDHRPQDSTTSPQTHHIDRKRMEQLQEKRIAAGHKSDDHEEEERYEQNRGMAMGGW